MFLPSDGLYNEFWLYLLLLFSHEVLSNSLQTPWTAVHQASLSFTISRSLLRLMSIESVMLSNHLIFCYPPSPFVFNLSQYQSLFQWVSPSHQMASHQYWSFSISPSNEYLGLISFKIDWFDLAVQETLESLVLGYYFYNIIDRGPHYFPLVVSFIILNSSWENSKRSFKLTAIFLDIFIWMLKGQGVWILVCLFGLILKWGSVFRR